MNEYTCCICFDESTNTIKTLCCHIFCEKCIKKWLCQSQEICSSCNKKFK